MLTKLHHIVIVLCCMGICLGSCGKDDDDSFDFEDEPQTGASQQIMVVFAPDELSGKGYAERLLTAAYQLKDSVISRDSLDVDFISSPNLETTAMNIEGWAEDTMNAIYDNAYDRRLLVLAEPFLVPMLANAKQYLRPTDEVLVLKTTDEDLRQADDTLHLDMGNRLHAMSISAAEVTRSWLDYRRWMLKVTGDEYAYSPKIILLRSYSDTVYHYCDSIYETLIEEGLTNDSINKISITSTPESLYYLLTDINSSLIELSYFVAQLTQMQYSLSGERQFAIIDLGMGNAAFKYHLMNSQNQEIIDVAMVNGDEQLGINCLYDVALQRWATRWLRQQPCTMPPMEWHGHWDGCCPDPYAPFKKYLLP